MECGACTACCRDLELHEIPSKIGEWCRHCTPGEGCQIYDDRPEECREFRCMWLQMERAGEDLRPDMCGVIFSRSSEDVIAARLDQDRLMSHLAFKQIERFVQEGFSVALFRGRECRIEHAEGHTTDHVLRAVHDRAVIHN